MFHITNINMKYFTEYFFNFIIQDIQVMLSLKANFIHLQSAAKLFEHLKLFGSKNSYLMQFYEISISQVMMIRLYAVYNKH